MTVRYSGPMRLFFNKHGAAPLMWCVSTDSWELAVKSLTVLGATVTSVYAPKPTPDDEDGKPSAWLEVEGELEVRDGNATVMAATPAMVAPKWTRCIGCDAPAEVLEPYREATAEEREAHPSVALFAGPPKVARCRCRNCGRNGLALDCWTDPDLEVLG